MLEEIEETSPLIKALLVNESLIYRAGQEGDYATVTRSASYQEAYSVEYGSEEAYYNPLISHSIYSDLADFLMLTSHNLLPSLFGLPVGRSVRALNGISSQVYENFALYERMRLGRFLYFYW